MLHSPTKLTPDPATHDVASVVAAVVAAIRAPTAWTPRGRNCWTLEPTHGERHTLHSIPTGYRGRHFELDARALLASPAAVDAAIREASA